MLVGNMDVKVLIGVGDETTAKYCSDEIGKHYIRREGWGTSVGGGSFVGGAPRASRTTQGRWELEPIVAPEALRRLDAKKSVLLVRGQYAAVLDKINFFTDGGYKRKVAASAPFRAQLNVPDAGADGLSSDWPADAAATITPVALGAKHDAAFARVIAAAEDIFVDAEPFRGAFVAAMNEASNGKVAADLQAASHRAPVARRSEEAARLLDATRGPAGRSDEIAAQRKLSPPEISSMRIAPKGRELQFTSDRILTIYEVLRLCFLPLI